MCKRRENMTAGPVGTAGMALLKALPRPALCGSHLARSRASAGAVVKSRDVVCEVVV